MSAGTYLWDELDKAKARVIDLEEQLEAARREISHWESYHGATTKLLREQLRSLHEAAAGALTALQQAGHESTFPAEALLERALASSPATTSSGEVLGTETPEAAGSASPETSSPAKVEGPETYAEAVADSSPAKRPT